MWLNALGNGKRHYPIVAIGGINSSNAEQVLSTGVGSIAMVRAITESVDYKCSITELNALIEQTVNEN